MEFTLPLSCEGSLLLDMVGDWCWVLVFADEEELNSCLVLYSLERGTHQHLHAELGRALYSRLGH